MIRDVTRNRIDVCAIQETKFQQLSNIFLDNHRVIFFKTKSPYNRNGFVISPRLENNIHKYWYMSDRVSILQIKLSNTKYCAYNIKKTSSEFKNSVQWNLYKTDTP